jgi:hypothetical protein
MIAILPSDSQVFHPRFIFRLRAISFHPAFISRHQHAPAPSTAAVPRPTRVDTQAEAKSESSRAAPCSRPHGEFIATVDLWQLELVKWPIMRVLTPGYVDHVALNHYLKQLLESGSWREVHAVPHADPTVRYEHVYDVYGERARD